MLDPMDLIRFGAQMLKFCYNVMIGWALKLLKMGLWFVIPFYYAFIVYIYTGGKDDTVNICFYLSIVLMIVGGALTFWRRYQLRKDPDYKLSEDMKKIGAGAAGLVGAISKNSGNTSKKKKSSTNVLDDFKGNTSAKSMGLEGVLYLGKQDGENCYINLEDKKNCGFLLVGGTGVGKSSTCIINSIILAKNNAAIPYGSKEKRQRVFCIDVKPEITDYYVKSHPSAEKIIIFSPKDPDSWYYDPLEAIRISDNPVADATLLAGQVVPMSGSPQSAYFETAARNLVASAFIYYLDPDTDTDIPKDEVSFSAIMEKVNLISNPKEFAEKVNESDCKDAKMLCNQLLTIKDSEAGSIYSSLKNAVSNFGTDRYLQKVLSKGEPEKTFSARDIETADAIFIKIDITDISTIYASITGIIVGQILSVLTKRKEDGFRNPDGSIVNNDVVSIFLDEFPVYAKSANSSMIADGVGMVETALATLRSKSVSPILISVQGLKQLDRVLGEKAASACIDNCITYVYQANDVSTQEWCAKRIGQEERRMKSTSVSQHDASLLHANTSVSVSLQDKYRIRPEEMSTLGSKETPYGMGIGVLIYNEGVTTIEKVPAFKHRDTGKYADDLFNLEKNFGYEEPTYCHMCGAEVEADSAFCTECGAQLVEENPKEKPKTDSSKKKKPKYIKIIKKVKRAMK